MKKILREIISLFIRIDEYEWDEWDWESPDERRRFLTYFKFM